MKQTHRPPRSIYPAQNRHMRRRTRVLAGLVDAIQTHLDRRAAGAFRVGAILFSNQHGPLGQTQTAKELLQAWTM